MRSRIAAALAVLSLIAGPARAADIDPAQVAKARAAVKVLGEGLKAQLMAAMKSGGPIAAMGVCKEIAPALAAQAGAERGLKIGRTALRVRNPANAPDAWERQVLEDFLAKTKAGANPATLEYAESVPQADGTLVFRYMKAIPMAAEPCLTCHGNPEPELKAEILRLYPQDQATGFKPGQLRGAFTVTGAAVPAPTPAPGLAPIPAPAPAPASPRGP